MKRLGAILIVLMLAAPAFACTTAVVAAHASKTGRPMLWKQRDAGDQYNILVNIEGGKFAYTGLFPTSDTLHTRCYAGINEVGFAIMNNLSYNLAPDSLVRKTRAGAMMARALSCCRTLSDFEDLLRSPDKPLPQSANFGVIDACGGAAYFEVSDTAFVRYDVPEEEGILFRTNYSLSGDPSRGKGFDRYETMDILTEPPGLFTPSFFLHTGRSYIRDGRDVLAGASSLEETGFIPRSTTVSSLVIEGVAAEGERGVIWCACGYTPCSYAIAAVQGAPLPAALQGPANLAAVELYGRVHPAGDKWLDCKYLRRVIRIVERFERREARQAARMMSRLRSGDVAEYNAGVENRFCEFKKKLKI